MKVLKKNAPSEVSSNSRERWEVEVRSGEWVAPNLRPTVFRPSGERVDEG